MAFSLTFEQRFSYLLVWTDSFSILLPFGPQLSNKTRNGHTPFVFSMQVKKAIFICGPTTANVDDCTHVVTADTENQLSRLLRILMSSQLNFWKR